MTEEQPPHQPVPEPSEPPTRSRQSKGGRKRLVLFALVIVALLSAGYFLPVRQWLTEFNHWVEEQGTWGLVWFGVVYVVCTVLFVPGSLLSLGAGPIYGPVAGTIL